MLYDKATQLLILFDDSNLLLAVHSGRPRQLH